MDKDNVVYTHTPTHLYIMEYYSAMEKEWNFVICNNMNEPVGYYV